MEDLAAKALPPGFSYEWTELALQEKLAGNSGIFIFAAAVVFVFLVLAALYESLTLPMAVILIVPMCVLAAILGVNLRGQDNNILTQIGFIVLIALAAKNAILIVAFAKQAEDERGVETHDAACRGSRHAAQADPDDVVRLHLRRAAFGHRHRRRRGNASGARHRRVLRHDRG